MATLQPGTTLSHYRILGKLGEGGMGVVYRALDTRLEREVALKVLRQDLAGDPERFARFQREARALAVLNHPHVGGIHQIDETGGVAFIVMELIEGQTLRQRIGGRPLPPDALLDLALQIADALAAAHSKGIVHRDIKPPNILVTDRGQIKMLDFGLAKLAASDGERDDGSSRLETALDHRQLTTPGSTMGTIAYMSPEQVRGEELDARSDLFSFGAVLYEMATGKCAFSAATSGLTFDAILNRSPAPPEQLNPDLPHRLAEIIHRALEKDRRLRYQSAADLYADLSRIRRDADSGRVASRPDIRPGPRDGRFAGGAGRRRRLIWAAAALVVVAAAGVLLNGPRDGGQGRLSAIAVLPFEYAGRDDDGEYLSDGITEALINGLSRIPELRVVPRSMIFAYKGRPLDPRTIGRELGVQGVVTGRVTQRDDKLIVSAELIDAATVAQIWGQQFTRPASEVFEVPEEIAREMFAALELRLTPDAEQRLARRYTDNPDAFAQYIKSRQQVRSGTRVEFREAIASAEQAIVEDMKQRALLTGPGPASGSGRAPAAPGAVQDPGFALAYAALARLYTQQAFQEYLPALDAHGKARAAAEFALQMDDGLAEAHGAIAFVRFFYEWDWAGAEKAFTQAVRLNPSDDQTRKDHAWYLMAMGRTGPAIEEMRKASELNPASAPLAAQLAEMLAWTGRDAEAAAEIERGRRIDPEAPPLLLVETYLLSRRGRHAEAIASYLDYLSVADKEAITSPTLAYFYAVAGRHDEAERILRRSAPGEISPAQMSWVAAAMGDKDKAFHWLGKAVEQRAGNVVWLKSQPWYEPLRSDPRFAALLREMKLPE
ncbi:MAG TPA: protein kinase [Candidatus Polarisedimenticolia bacterium]|nr:protein kinase [Candidatus Polarisedimenticolia bacterium]